MTGKSFDCQIAIVGAGPYGLSAAAHLRVAGMEPTVFGDPMNFWANGMPSGMLLRSPRPASTISDPRAAFTLEAYEAASERNRSSVLRGRHLSHTESGFKNKGAAIWTHGVFSRFAVIALALAHSR